jgi:hypothetical protein
MKNTIKAIRAIIYLIAIIGIGCWAWKNFAPGKSARSISESSPTADSSAKSVINQSEHIVVVTYFTSDQRCDTCLKIEKLTQDAIHSQFTDALEKKEIIFQTINYDKAENKHFIDDYQLAFKTVVVSERKKGQEQRWSKYDKVWELVNDPEEFSSYLQQGISQYLNQQPLDQQPLGQPSNTSPKKSPHDA